jgi:hypothetical protein
MLSTVQVRGAEFKQADTDSNMFIKKARHTTTITNRQTDSNDSLEIRETDVKMPL